MLLLLVALLDVFLADVNSALLPEAKRASEESSLIDAVHDLDFDPETLEELHPHNLPLLEGDMVLSSDRNALGRTWPTLEIPFDIDSDLNGHTKDITAAMAMISKVTCLSFHKRTVEKDYLLFQSGEGCASYVGFITGKQPVFVGPRCNVGNIVHEILHALGFHHEHTRLDRDQYITIHNENIQEGKEKNFRKHDGETFSLPYDIMSILHYGRHFFSANGKPTIIAKKEDMLMGQRVQLTSNDIKKVRKLYHCDAFQPSFNKALDTSRDMNAADNQTFDFVSGNQSVASPSAPLALLQLLNSTSMGCNELTGC